VPLCSFDNRVNQKYNIQGFTMTKAEEKKLADEAKAKEEQEAKERLADEAKDLNIVEMLQEAKTLKRFKRRAWGKNLENTYVSINRGETLPILMTGRHSIAYQPSIEDVMRADWYEVQV